VNCAIKTAYWSYKREREREREREKGADLYEQVHVILRELLHCLDGSAVASKANSAEFVVLAPCVPAEELVALIQSIRNLIAGTHGQ